MPSVLMDSDDDAHITYFLSERSESDIEFQPLDVGVLTELSVRPSRDLPDIIHFQYLQYKVFIDDRPIRTTIKTVHFVLFLLVLRLRGVSFVWSAHNLESHECPSKLVDRVIRIYVANLCDRVIVLHEGMKESVKRRLYCRTDIVVAPLGNYREYHEAQVDSDPVGSVRFERDDGPKVGMIGAVRRYKEIPLGMRGVERSEKEPFLQVAGSPRIDAVGEELAAVAEERDAEISTDFRYLSDADILYYNDNVDATLILHSIEGAPASLNLAASSSVPIVATDGGMKGELVEKYDLGAVVENTPQAVADGIDEVLEREPASFGFERFTADHTWNNYVRVHDEVYESIAADTSA